MDKRTVLLENGEKPFEELQHGDVFQIREPDGKLHEEKWEACSDLYTNDDGILSIMANPSGEENVSAE